MEIKSHLPGAIDMVDWLEEGECNNALTLRHCVFDWRVNVQHDGLNLIVEHVLHCCSFVFIA